MGSNMAEQHPVGFQWVVEAKERGASVMHVDPRFTRTSAIADAHVALRAGTDIAFLGGIINYILSGGREFTEYVRHYTNARVIIKDEFRDVDELGLFSGWVPEDGAYEVSSWGYEGTDGELTAGKREQTGDVSGDQAHGAHGMKLEHGEPPEQDWTLEHPNCVFQILKRHFARYTPETVEEICGVPREKLLLVAETLCRNSGRERTAAICYAVGWTQHTHGVQNIRAASIIQLLLGNIGRPGGGILALRGHANIQGSTDIPTLYDILPGYIPMPHPASEDDLDKFVELNGPDTGAWGELKSYVVSMLKAWWGEAATPENNFAYPYLPRINGDHSHYPMMLRMIDRETRGFIVIGQNPVVGSANSSLQRKALASLDWLVVRDMVEIETAAFWYDSPEIDTGEMRPEDIGTEVFFMPAAAYTEKDGTFTNTQRLLQWRFKAVEPPLDCRSDLWFTHQLGRRVREKLSGSRDPKDRPILDLTWDYPTQGPQEEPDAETIMQEVERPPRRRRLHLEIPGTEGRRFDDVRLVDPRRHLRRRRQPGGSQEAGLGAELDRARVGLGVARRPTHPLQPCLRRPGGRALVRAQALHLVGQRAEAVGERRRQPGLRAGQAPGVRAARGRQGNGGDQR